MIDGAERNRKGAHIALVLVAAIADNDVIGSAGGLPWRLKSDMHHFRALTSGKPVVMGHKTYQSIGRPLPDRTNIVVSRDPAVSIDKVVVATSLEAALVVARGDALRRQAKAIVIIGGADLYAQTLALADRLEITRVHIAPRGGESIMKPLPGNFGIFRRWRRLFIHRMRMRTSRQSER